MDSSIVKYGIPVALAGAGAWGGSLIAKKMGKNSTLGLVIGLVVGGVAGYFIGNAVAREEKPASTTSTSTPSATLPKGKPPVKKEGEEKSGFLVSAYNKKAGCSSGAHAQPDENGKLWCVEK